MNLSEVVDVAAIVNYLRSPLGWVRKKIRLLKQRAIGRYQARQSHSQHRQEIDEFLGQIADDFEVAQAKPSSRERADAIANAVSTLRSWLLSSNLGNDLSEYSAAMDLETCLEDLSAALNHYQRITNELNNPQIQQKSFSRDAPGEARTRLDETLEQITNDISEVRKQLQKSRSS